MYGIFVWIFGICVNRLLTLTIYFYAILSTNINSFCFTLSAINVISVWLTVCAQYILVHVKAISSL